MFFSRAIDMFIAGVDEAGRGSVLGPLVIALVAGEEDSLSPEYRDSKAIGKTKRRMLAEMICKTLETHVSIISATEINASMHAKESLNVLEARHVAQLIQKLSRVPDAVYIDSPYPEPARYVREIKRFLAPEFHTIRLICENRADARYRIVGAASIVAKVQRDRAIEDIKRIVGVDFNSGYPSDAITRAFLQQHRYDEKVAPFLRTRWKTLKRLPQTTLEMWKETTVKNNECAH